MSIEVVNVLISAIAPYQSVTLEELAGIIGCAVEQFQEDADRFGIGVNDLVKQPCQLEPRLQVGEIYRGEIYRYDQSLV